MRVDKFLWAVRTFKTRAISAEACKKGHVQINRKPVKAAKVLTGEETLVIRKNQMDITLKVKAFPPSRVGAAKLEDYIEDLTPTPTSSYHGVKSEVKTKLKVKQYRDKEKKISKRSRLQALRAKLGLDEL